MIAQFPSFYPDELVYSLLARYYVRSGYMRYTFAAEDLFQSKTVRPDIEFVNQYTPAALQMITKNMPLEQVIEKHTMFPYYGRFLFKERRNKAFEALVHMQGNYHNLLPMPKRKNGTDRFLRYCPVCAENDRKQYGEAYWHRLHQLQGIKICPIHGCYMNDSDVMISGKTSPTLVSAETTIPKKINSPLFSENRLEFKIARYVADVFSSELDLQGDVTVGQFIHSRLENTPYRSIRGEQRNIALLHTDFTEYYQNMTDNWFTELWQIQKVLTDDRVNSYEICLLALFLNIPSADLVKMKLPELTQEQRFDEQIFKLHEQGLKYPEIARRLGASYDVVKAIGGRRYGKYCKQPKKALKCGIKAYDWQQIDIETLPMVKDAICKLQGDRNTRPKKVTVYAVQKMLGLPDKQIDHLPQCKEEITKYQESQAQYWAREVVWAVNKVLSEGEVLNWKHIRSLTNMRKRDFVACIPYVQDYADGNIADMIYDLV